MEAAKKVVVEFMQLVSGEKMSPEQVYNADKTALYWRYELMKYSETIISPKLTDLHKSNIEEWFTVHSDVPVHYTDEDILGMASNKNNKDKNFSEDSDDYDAAEKNYTGLPAQLAVVRQAMVYTPAAGRPPIHHSTLLIHKFPSNHPHAAVWRTVSVGEEGIK
ncbi:hypothetical protein PR048_020044 [Dryococelus australis]|uniref:Uncharacterized protein n=1 Tax=Dryococelus australis TaxID=614101 RepID=A0ABQ9H566_9NEOP|nr:hypothetical protein PR048_020044 [Dryococelus australis]